MDERQKRELEYHRQFAELHRDKIEKAVDLDVISPGPRRKWNAYWSSYDAIMEKDVAGKNVLVPGCGFGEDAIRLAKLGARVYASDLSPELIEISRQRANHMGIANIAFDVMPAEALSYEDDSFDLIYFNDILHHVNIPKTLLEAKRVLKRGGTVVANELYTHSSLQKIRESKFVTGFLYKRMVSFIYGTKTPYITEDERKINENELNLLFSILIPGFKLDYFMLLCGRIVPSYWTSYAKLDHFILNISKRFGNLLAGRAVIVGTIDK